MLEAVSDSNIAGNKEVLARGEQMNSEWKAEYHDAKASCVSLMQQLGDGEAVWALSAEFLYFDGLVQAAFEMFPPPKGLMLMQEQLSGRPARDASLRHRASSSGGGGGGGGVVGTDPQGRTLAQVCFTWLEEMQRPAEILELGEHCEPKSLLWNFLKVILSPPGPSLLSRFLPLPLSSLHCLSHLFQKVI